MMKPLLAQQRVIFQPETTRVSITVRNLETKNIVVQTTPIHLGIRPSKPVQQLITLDKKGSGAIDIILKSPVFIKIMNIWKDSSVDYLVMPGKNFSVTLDAQDRNFARYGEDWEKENDFDNFMMADAQRRLDEIPQNDPKVFIRDWTKQNDYSHSLIQIANDHGTDSHYTAWVLQSVHSLFYGTLIRQLVNYITITGKWPGNMEQYIQLFEPLNDFQFSNPSYFTSESDKEWVEQYFLYDAAIHFYNEDSSHVPIMEEIYKYALSEAGKIKEPGVKKIITQYMAKQAVERTDGIKLLNWLQHFLRDQPEFRYYNAIIGSREQLLHMAPKGGPALFFKAEDVNGNAFSFADYKGRYIYIDVWATWCIPCRKQIPYLDEIKKKYQEKPIEFVSISQDKSIDDWKKYLHNIPESSGQYISDPDLKESITATYRIRMIPTFILIDPDGKIVSTNCYAPSNPALDMLLKKLLD